MPALRHNDQDRHYPLAEITLPPGWEKVFVGDVCLGIQPGFASGQHNSTGEGVPHLRPMNISREGSLDFSDVRYVPDKDGLRLKLGDVLFNNTNSNELIGKTCWVDADRELAFSNHMTRLRLGDGMSPSFVAGQLHFLWMTGYLRYRCTSHVNQASISSKTLALTIPLFVPSAREQERIVAKLDALLSRVAAGEAAARHALKRLKRYRAAVLHAAVTGELTRDWRKTHKPDETGAQLLKRLLQERRARWEAAELKRLQAAGKPPKDDKWKRKYPEPTPPSADNLPSLPKGWVWASIDQLTMLVTSGSRGWKSYYSKSGAIFIRSQDIRTDELDLADIAHVRPPKNSEGIRTQVSQHDLLVTITGANVGKSALVKQGLDEAYVSQHVGMIRFVDPQPVRLAHLYITAPADGRKRLLALAYGAGKPGLNLEHLRELTIPLPPLAEQEKLVRETERRLAAADRLANILIPGSNSGRARR